eukprot:g17468.t1
MEETETSCETGSRDLTYHIHDCVWTMPEVQREFDTRPSKVLGLAGAQHEGASFDGMPGPGPFTSAWHRSGLAQQFELERQQTASSLASLQQQVDRMMSSVGEVVLQQNQMKTELAAATSQVEELWKERSCPTGEPQRSPASPRGCVPPWLKPSRRLADRAVSGNECAGAEVRELSAAFKPMIARITLLSEQCEAPNSTKDEEAQPQPEVKRIPASWEETPDAADAEVPTSVAAARAPAGSPELGMLRAAEASSRGPTLLEAAGRPQVEEGEQKAKVIQIPIQRRSSAPGPFLNVAPQQSPRSPTTAVPAGRMRRHRHPAPCGCHACCQAEPFRMDLAGSILSVHSQPMGATVQEASRMNPQDQERNPKIHQEDVMVRADGCGEESDTDSRGGIHVGRELAEILEATRLEAMRMAVATARPPPPAPPALPAPRIPAALDEGRGIDTFFHNT